jgi:hypothetical protein
MNLLELQQMMISKTILFEDAAGSNSASMGSAGTTASNIQYTPEEFPGDSIRKRFKSMSQKKKNWGVVISELPESKEVNFDDYFTIEVSNDLWESFKQKIFGSPRLPDGSFQVDLTGYLAEAEEDAIEQSLAQLRVFVVSFLNSQIMVSYRHKISSFERESGSNLNFGTEGKSLFTNSNLTGDLQNFLNLVSKYPIGDIQLLAHAFQNKESLAGIDGLNGYDNIDSIILSGQFLGVDFNYNSKIDMNFQAVEFMNFQDRNLLFNLSKDNRFKVVEGKVYPVETSGFPINVNNILSEYIKGV